MISTYFSHVTSAPVKVGSQSLNKICRNGDQYLCFKSKFSVMFNFSLVRLHHSFLMFMFDETIQGELLYLFYETKNSVTWHGDIGVAKSVDKGATWEILGIALDEEWHLSYPYVFDYNGNVRSQL